MVANKEKLQSFLKAKKLTSEDFAQLLDVDRCEVDKLLAGERVGYDTAKKFIYFFRGEVAQHYINWDVMGIENPLNKKENVDKVIYVESTKENNYGGENI